MNRHEANGKSLRRVWKQGAVGVVALVALGLAAPACLDRPVAPQQPLTKRISTQRYQNEGVDKIDILFMIDNSASMADKQKILAQAVPDLVERLTNPVCVDRTSRALVGDAAPGVECMAAYPGTDSEREFKPIDDIHIGVISSSLGGHGADSCSDVPTQNWNPRQEDMAHLITRSETGTVDTYQGQGFLNWDPSGLKSDPPGEADVATLKSNFTNMVRGAGQDGCGFEASLESWYRFLVDPAPYEKMIPVPCYDGDTGNQCRGPEGVDQVVLQQRADFLRMDSLMAVIMLSDENDCSVIDDRQNFLALQALDGTGAFHLAHGTNACLDDPWSENCKSCWEVKVENFPECGTNWPDPDRDDQLNLRCFQQKRRFGIDFLHPIRRYVEGLSNARLADGSFNPLFCNSQEQVAGTWECNHLPRDPSFVFVAGIVGVPWQDIAENPADLTQGYRPASQLNWTPEMFTANSMTPPNGLEAGKTLWNMILGETGDGQDANRMYEINPNVDPLDPLMKESVTPRTGTHPATGEPLVAPGSSNPVANPVNGSEWDITKSNDLQYACVFQLDAPLDCALPENAFGCDCNLSPENPLCWNGSSFGTMQNRAKAYPGRRQLAVLKGMADQAIVASVCPSNMSNPLADDFGYRPAIGAIVDRLKAALQGTCWNEELTIAADGTVNCVVLEATAGEEAAGGTVTCPPCGGAREEASESQIGALESDQFYKASGLNCVCQISQAAPGDALKACVSQDVVNNVAGWCYIDPQQDPSHNSEIVANCPSGNKRIIRFVGQDVPTAGSLTFLQCVGASLGS